MARLRTTARIVPGAGAPGKGAAGAPRQAHDVDRSP